MSESEFREVYGTAGDTTARLFQVVVLVAAMVAEERARAREEVFRAEVRADQERIAAELEKVRAERAAAEPVLRAAHQERFWPNLPENPERLGRTWQAAAEWAPTDPYAAFTLQHLKDELRERYGVQVPDWPAAGEDLSRLLVMADPAYRERLAEAREAAAETPEVSYAVLVRESGAEGRTLSRTEVQAHAGATPVVVGAEEFAKWRQQREAEDRDPAVLTVEVIENTGQVESALVPAASLNGDVVDEVLAEDARRRRALLDGQSQPESNEEMLRALSLALEDLEGEEQSRLARQREHREALTQTGVSESDTQRLTGEISAIDEGLETLRREQADMALRIAATAADMRGESGQHVYDAEQLRQSLDPGWWATASAREIAGVWEHVEQWQEGQARTAMREELRTRIEDRAGMGLPEGASAETVAALFGGQDAPGAAAPLNEEAEGLRSAAQGLYEDAFDAYSKAREMEAAGGEGAAEGAALLRRQAEADTERGNVFTEQATWMESAAPEAMRATVADNSGTALHELREEFARRWGEPPSPEAAAVLEKVAEAGQDGPWKVVASVGSADPAALPLVVEERPAPEPVHTLEAEHDRYEEAWARLAGARDQVADTEAVEAVQLAEMSFPQGPEAAVERPPASGSSQPQQGAERGLQRDAGIHR